MHAWLPQLDPAGEDGALEAEAEGDGELAEPHGDVVPVLAQAL